MNDIKLIVSDIDGTLLPALADASEVAKNQDLKTMLERLNANGIFFSVATGRDCATALEIAHGLKLTTPIIAANGSMIINPKNDGVIWRESLNYEQSLEIFKKVSSEVDTSAMMCGEGIERAVSWSDFSDAKLRNANYLDVIGIINFDYTQELINYVRKIGLDASWVHSPQVVSSYNVLITHRNGTKSHALAYLQKYLKVSKSQTMVIGDSNNDLPLFGQAGLSVAMANASDEVTKAADMTTTSVEQNGVVSIVNEIVLSK